MTGAYRGNGSPFLLQFLSRNYAVWVTLYQPSNSINAIGFIRVRALTFMDNYKYVGARCSRAFNPPMTRPKGYRGLSSFNDASVINIRLLHIAVFSEV